MGHILAVELRRSRMRYWAVVSMAVWLLVQVPSAHRWNTDWPEAALWAVMPALYAGPLLAAGAADCARSRAGSPPWVAVTYRPSRRPAAVAVHLVATLAWVLAVPLAGLVVAAVMAWPEAGPGAPLSGFTATGLLVTAVSGGLGYTIGSVFPSALLAPALSLFVTLMITMKAPSLPPSDQPWYAAHPLIMSLWACAFAMSLAAAAAAQLGRHLDTRPSPVHNTLSIAAVLSTVAAVLVVLAPTAIVGDGPARYGRSGDLLDYDAMQGRVFRPTPSEPACATTTQQTSVCVWPQEAHRYLEPLVAQAQRFDDVRTALGATGAVAIGQPGLVDERDKRSVLLETVGDGDGLWLAAGPLAAWAEWASGDFASSRCDYVPDDEDGELGWALHRVASSYVFGASRPASVQIIGDDGTSDNLVSDVLARSPHEQLRWMTETNETLLAPCLAALD